MHEENYLIDTSVLFKRYVNEQGSVVIDSIFNEKANRYISQVTLIKVVSNLRRLIEIDMLITAPEFELLKDTFLGDIGKGRVAFTVLIPRRVSFLKGLHFAQNVILRQ